MHEYNLDLCSWEAEDGLKIIKRGNRDAGRTSALNMTTINFTVDVGELALGKQAPAHTPVIKEAVINGKYIANRERRDH